MVKVLIFGMLTFCFAFLYAGKKQSACPKKIHAFRLRPSTLPDAGVGVFAVELIPAGSFLPGLFDPRERILRLTEKKFRELPLPKEVKKTFSIQYRVKNKKVYIIAAKTNRLSIGWYLNHGSRRNKPNLAHDKNYNYFAARDIEAGEELFIDYNQL